MAQTPPPPNPSQIDEHGVDLVSGKLIAGETDLAIGPSDHHGVQLSRQWSASGWRLSELATISGSSYNPIVSFGGQSIPFTGSPSSYTPVFEDGSSLVFASSAYTFTSSDGTQVAFTPPSYFYTQLTNLGLVSQVTFPDGVRWNYHYVEGSYTDGPEIPPECYEATDPYVLAYCYYLQQSQYTVYVKRLTSITTTTGYQIKLTYASNTLSAATVADWVRVASAKAINNAVEYCNPTASSCSLSGTWPEATYSTWTGGTIASVTGPTGGTTSYSYSLSGTYQYQLTGITPPGAGSSLVTYGYTSDKVSSVTRGGSTWSYSYATNTATVDGPVSGSGDARTTNFNSSGQTTSMVTGGQTTSFSYCAGGSGCPAGLLQTATAPETNYTTYVYDARGNTTSVTRVAKSGSGLSNIVTSATYPGSCSNPKTCNKPTSTTDARGQVTDYTYDSGHGGLLTATLPADGAGVRPETRITYSSVNARYLTAASTWSNGTAFSAPAAISTCRTAASGDPDYCIGTVDERVMTVAYPSGVPSNAQRSSVTTKAGNNTLVATATVSYDDYGRPTVIDGPQSGSTDATLTAYNLANQPLWQIGPDPDGAESALFPAVKYTYRSDGQVDYVQSGTVTAQSSSGMSGSFSELQRQTIAYDSYHRPSRQTVSSGGTAYQVSDQVYDVAGRVLCSVLRMDGLASPGSLLTGCSPPQTGSGNGPDRVTYNHYDALGRVWKVTTAYGVSGQAADEAISTFSNNGRLATLTDAEGNMTTYEYDGHDRLVKTRFPSPTTDNTSSTTDYEEVGYDANGNVTSFRTRAAETLTMSYDNLNRLTLKVVPDRSGLDATHERDVFFGYDLHGNMLYARFDSTSGEGVTNAFNALGQQLDSNVNLDYVSRTIWHGYDVAGTYTQLVYPDGNSVNYYPHASSGELYYAALNGGYPLFYPPRDTAGRTNMLYRWNTSAGNWYAGMTGFTYDAMSRLSILAHDLASTTYDVQTNFAYNPASQLTSGARNNDNYAWNGAAAINRNYTANGLNEYTAVGGTSFTYDANGNLTYDGTQTFTYDIENRLVARSGGGTTAALRYDPLGRLYEVTGSATGTTRFLYSGDELVAEYNTGGTLLRRYVHGIGAGDDPLVWFEGSGVSDGVRKYLHADERGSIVAVTDSNGSSVTVNSYDEYGIPASGNAGRFGYTGQAWVPELGMNYYKARMYSPSLGRFMQTDPIGYGDGMNMYAYVRNDPMNAVDPTGMQDIRVTHPRCGGAVQGWSCTGGGAGVGGGGGGGPSFPTGLPTLGVMCENQSAWAGVVQRLEYICEGPESAIPPDPAPVSDPEPTSCTPQLIAHTQFGETYGMNPRSAGSRVNTDLPGEAGNFAEAYAYYWAINVKSGSMWGHTPGPPGSPIIFQSSNGIILRRSTTPGDPRYRIDIPPGVLDLSRRESIHVGTLEAPRCPLPTS